MALPELDEISRSRPIGYCPTCKRFIYYDDVVSGECAIVPLEKLSEADLKKLVAKRFEVLPEDMKSGPMSGPASPREIIGMIERDEPFGRMTVQADINYLRSFLEDIAAELEKAEE